MSPFSPHNEYNTNYDDFGNSMTHSLSIKKIIQISN
jgi:hypothetical protein